MILPNILHFESSLERSLGFHQYFAGNQRKRMVRANSLMRRQATQNRAANSGERQPYFEIIQ